MLHRYIRQTQTCHSVVSVIVMRTDEKSRRTSVASFDVQTLTVSGPTLIKLFYIYFKASCKYSIAARRDSSTFQETVHVRDDPSPMAIFTSSRWINVDSNSQILVARSYQIVTCSVNVPRDAPCYVHNVKNVFYV